MSDDIPVAALIEHANKRLSNLVERPLYHAGTWPRVQGFILELLHHREFALAWPEAGPGHLAERWAYACALAHRKSNWGLYETLVYDGITDDNTVQETFCTAVSEFLRDEGLYPHLLPAHGCHPEQGYCMDGCGTWPCEFATGESVAAYWQRRFAHRKESRTTVTLDLPNSLVREMEAQAGGKPLEDHIVEMARFGLEAVKSTERRRQAELACFYRLIGITPPDPE